MSTDFEEGLHNLRTVGGALGQYGTSGLEVGGGGAINTTHNLDNGAAAYGIGAGVNWLLFSSANPAG